MTYPLARLVLFYAFCGAILLASAAAAAPAIPL